MARVRGRPIPGGHGPRHLREGGNGSVDPGRRRLADLDRDLEAMRATPRDREVVHAFGEFLEAIGVPADGTPARDPARARRALAAMEYVGDRTAADWGSGG